MHFGFGGFGGFGMIFFWVALIAVIVILIKVLTDSARNRDSRAKTALDTLKNRYAAGEITRVEFEEKKRDLAER